MDALGPRITQSVLLGAIGRGRDAFDGFRSADVPLFRTTDLTPMAAPALVVAGDKDDSRHWTTTGPDWHADPYDLAPRPETGRADHRPRRLRAGLLQGIAEGRDGGGGSGGSTTCRRGRRFRTLVACACAPH
ncbi:hypothetical protein AB0P12_16315 [Streptomyces subrutilus]|uniref:hypothetical protein n=1 Tax=Streptomyces subrutilus TaxID=36818 RepID=UPI0033C27639